MPKTWPETLTATAPSEKPVEYLSPAWANRALWLVENDKTIRDAVHGADVSLLVNIEHAPAGRAKHLYVHFQGGSLVEHYIGDGHGTPSIPEPDFELRGEYATFWEIQEGKLDGKKALLLGRLKLHGSMLRAVKHMGALEALVAGLTAIPCSI